MLSDELADHVAAIGALAEPTRRELYRYVAAETEPVSREQAANALGLPLHAVKFHLDRLVADGLLDVEFRRLSGRSGPGAGRPAKLYRRSARQFAVSLPDRRYDLVGDVLATAIDRSMREGIDISEAVRNAAEDTGRRLASSSVTDQESAPSAATTSDRGRRDDLGRTVAVLARHGYEPRMSGRTVQLANCPFDRLAAKHTDLVCGMNLALISGVLDELRTRSVTAELVPQAGYCCVQVHG